MQKGDQEPVLELSNKVNFPIRFAEEAKKATPLDYPLLNTGFPMTIGEVIKKELELTQDYSIESNDWQRDPAFGGISRRILLSQAVTHAIVKSEINTVENFPKAGVSFKDIVPLLANPDLFQSVIRSIAMQYQDKSIDAIAGLESRGFLNETEYSRDAIEISTPSLAGKNHFDCGRPPCDRGNLTCGSRPYTVCRGKAHILHLSGRTAGFGRQKKADWAIFIYPKILNSIIYTHTLKEMRCYDKNNYFNV